MKYSDSNSDSLEKTRRFVLARSLFVQNFYETPDQEEGERLEVTTRPSVVLSQPPHHGMLILSTATTAAVVVGRDPAYRRMTIFMQDLASERLRLVNPLAAAVEASDRSAVAYCFDLDEIGYGESEAEALDELRAGIVDAYFLLKRERENLGPLQQRHWAFLTRMVREI